MKKLSPFFSGETGGNHVANHYDFFGNSDKPEHDRFTQT
jgi:hypothetical protein